MRVAMNLLVIQNSVLNAENQFVVINEDGETEEKMTTTKVEY